MNEALAAGAVDQLNGSRKQLLGLVKLTGADGGTYLLGGGAHFGLLRRVKGLALDALPILLFCGLDVSQLRFLLRCSDGCQILRFCFQGESRITERLGPPIVGTICRSQGTPPGEADKAGSPPDPIAGNLKPDPGSV